MQGRLIPSELPARNPRASPRDTVILFASYTPKPCNGSTAVSMCFHQELRLILQKREPGVSCEGPRDVPSAAVPISGTDQQIQVVKP